MWTKGAVVIVKHGDEGMANGMAKAIAPSYVDQREMERLRRDNYFLKQKGRRATNRMIKRAQRRYGTKRRTPERFKWLREGFAFVEYCFATLIEKAIGR